MSSSFLKHLSPWIAWSLVALFAGISLFTTWYYYFEASTAYDNSVTFFGLNVSKNKTTTAPSTTTSSTSATANWKTFNNKTYDYSIKYPTSLYLTNGLHIKNTDNLTAADQWVFLEPKQDTSKYYIADADFPQPYFEIISHTGEGQLPSVGDTIIETTTQITFVSQKAYKTIAKTPGSLSGSYYTNIKFNKDGNWFDISWENSDVNGTHDAVIDQILSTFQFTK